MKNSIRITGGNLKGKKIPFDFKSSLRPTSSKLREVLFNWLQFEIQDYKCLDLFAGTGALGIEAISRGAEKTVFIAITYNPYNENTTQAVKTAKKANSKVILLTDTELNPIAHLADFLFSIHEAEIHTFRSLGATMCLVQAICISIGYHQQGN